MADITQPLKQDHVVTVDDSAKKIEKTASDGSDSTDTPPPYQVLNSSEKRYIIIATGMSLFLAALDQNIVVVALPQIVKDLDGLSKQSWILAAYMLTSSATMALYGRFSDVYGRRVVFLVAIGLFFTGSALCGSSSGIWFLIIARGVQGLGAGGLMSLCMIIVGDVVEPALRPKYMSALSSVFGLASILGPLIGGFFVDKASWRWIFFLNLPLAGLAFVMCAYNMRHFKVPTLRLALDVLGSALICSAVICIVLFVIWGGAADGYPWDSGVIIGLICASIVLLVAFIIQERRHPYPILNLSLFWKASNFGVIMLMMFFAGVLMLGGFAYIPVYFEVIRGDTAVISGLKLIPIVLGFLISAGVGGVRLMKTGRFDYVIPISIALFTLGSGLLIGLAQDTNFGIIFVYLFLMGFGMGLLFSTTSTVVQNSVPVEDNANAMAAFTFFQSMGGAIGIAVMGAVFNGYYGVHGDYYFNIDDYMVGLNYVFLTATIPGVVVLFASFFMKYYVLFGKEGKQDPKLPKQPASPKNASDSNANKTTTTTTNGDSNTTSTKSASSDAEKTSSSSPPPAYESSNADAAPATTSSEPSAPPAQQQPDIEITNPNPPPQVGISITPTNDSPLQNSTGEGS